MNALALLVACSVVSLVGNALAYDLHTHSDLSGRAADQSILGDEARRASLGLRYPIDSDNKAQMFVGSKGGATTIRDLIANGAMYEDDFPPGPLYHFFDPRTNSPLHINASDYPSVPTWAADFINARTGTSPDWVVLGQGASPEVNTYSFPNAREYLFSALSVANKQQRDLYTGLVFDSLGRMIHHLQDMAQPQHVRNDGHLAVKFMDWFCPSDPKTGSFCQAYLALRRPSAYETWTEFPFVRDRLPLQGYDPVYPGPDPNPDGIRTFASPRLFWANNGKGIAEFTNRNFFSAGTMDQSPPSMGAPYDVDVKILCAGAIPPCGVQPDAKVTFFPSYVDDQFRPGDGPWVNQYAAGASILDPEFKTITGRRLTTVNRFTFARDHELLLPRAVAYSAGLINYFFRGQMETAAPAEGVYAIIDHSPANGCETSCGFRKIRLKVRNTTLNDDMVNDAANPGTLILVAKYHLNQCFHADLSGEFGAPGYPDASCRSADEIVTVSNPIQVTSIDRTFPAEALEFTFVGNVAIPVNATDLFLQLVYKGRLGSEDGAVAVTTLDLQEPTFLIFSNDNDYINMYNADGSYLRTDAYQSQPGRFSLHLDLRFNQSAPSPIASNTQLDPGYYHRLAILTDQQVLPFWVGEQFVGGDRLTQEFMLAASENQFDTDDQPVDYPPYVQLRRTTSSSWAYASDVDGGAIYWMPGVNCINGSGQCNPEDKGIGSYVRRYPPFKQSTPVPMDVSF